MQRTKQMFLDKMSIKDGLTTDAYTKRIKYFEEWWNDKFSGKDMFEEMKGNDLWDFLQMYVNYLAKTRAPNTVWNYVTSLRKYLHYMGINECDKDSFRENIDLPEKHEKELYPLKIDEIKLILDKMEYPDKVLFLSQSSCGARIGEMLQIRKKYFVFDFQRLMIKLPHTITKFHKARTVILSKESAAYLKPILNKLNDDDLVFTKNNNVRSAVTIKEGVLRNALNRCGLDMRYDDTNHYKINTHSFRAYFITKASRSDANIAKKLAGEKGYLLMYDRVEDNDLLEAFMKFEINLCIYDDIRQTLELEDEKKKNLQLEEKTRNKISSMEELIKELQEKQEHQSKILRMIEKYQS